MSLFSDICMYMCPVLKSDLDSANILYYFYIFVCESLNSNF